VISPPFSEDHNQRLREYLLDSAIGAALNNQKDVARKWLDAAVKNFPDDETAPEIQKELN
jgi:hypothetical protein